MNKKENTVFCLLIQNKFKYKNKVLKKKRKKKSFNTN